MQVDFFHLCRGFQINPNNTLTLSEIFDQFPTPDIRTIQKPFRIACRLLFNPLEGTDHQYKITIEDPENKQLAFSLSDPMKSFATINPPFSYGTLNLEVPSVVFASYGLYWVKLVVDKNDALEFPFRVSRV